MQTFWAAKEVPWIHLRHVYVLAVVTTAWVFFRLESLSEALDYVAVMYGFGEGGAVPGSLLLMLDREQLLVLSLALLLCIPVYRWLALQWAVPLGRNRPGVYALQQLVFIVPLLWLALLSVASSAYNPFIYFRF